MPHLNKAPKGYPVCGVDYIRQDAQTGVRIMWCENHIRINFGLARRELFYRARSVPPLPHTHNTCTQHTPSPTQRVEGSPGVTAET